MEVIQICTADIAQLDPLEVIPDALIRIEIRDIAGKVLQMQALGGSSFQESCDLLSPGVSLVGRMDSSKVGRVVNYKGHHYQKQEAVGICKNSYSFLIGI